MKNGKTYYADTSFLIDLLNEKERALEIFSEIENIFTGTPVIYELCKFPNFDREIINEKILDLSSEDMEKAAETWRNLDNNGERIGEIDHIIAGQAINREMILVTRDKDFKKIKEVEILDY